MAEKKYVVKHAKLNLLAGGKLTRMPQGSTVSMSEEAAASLIASGKLALPGATKSVKVGAKAEAEAEAEAETKTEAK